MHPLVHTLLAAFLWGDGREGEIGAISRSYKGGTGTLLGEQSSGKFHALRFSQTAVAERLKTTTAGSAGSNLDRPTRRAARFNPPPGGEPGGEDAPPAITVSAGRPTSSVCTFEGEIFFAIAARIMSTLSFNSSIRACDGLAGMLLPCKYGRQIT